jgi:hypothetical protein
MPADAPTILATLHHLTEAARGTLPAGYAIDDGAGVDRPGGAEATDKSVESDYF